jgi:very-short-patch-repair endonuclease
MEMSDSLENSSSIESPREGNKRREIIGYERYLKELARKLRNKRKQVRGDDFDRQRPIDRYIVDFYCKDLKLAIEIDGSSHDEVGNTPTLLPRSE